MRNFVARPAVGQRPAAQEDVEVSFEEMSPMLVPVYNIEKYSSAIIPGLNSTGRYRIPWGHVSTHSTPAWRYEHCFLPQVQNYSVKHSASTGK